MITPKARARVRLVGAMEIARGIPYAAAKGAIKCGYGLPGAVMLFDVTSAVLIGTLDKMSTKTGVRFDPTVDLFDLPDWNELADMAGETLSAARLRELAEQSRRKLGFTQTILTLAKIDEV